MESKETSKFADMFAALGSEQRLEILRLLIAAHPEGKTVGEVGEKLNIPNSTLSHHLDKLRLEGLVEVRKDRQWIWHAVNLKAVEELVSFLCSSCCTPQSIQPMLSKIRQACCPSSATKENKPTSKPKARKRKKND